MNSKLLRAYKDVFGSAGPATKRKDEEVEKILTRNRVRTKDGARVLARKELSGQFSPEEQAKADKAQEEETKEARKLALAGVR